MVKVIECAYRGDIIVSDDFDCSYCDECIFCPESSYDEEEDEEDD